MLILRKIAEIKNGLLDLLRDITPDNPAHNQIRTALKHVEEARRELNDQVAKQQGHDQKS